MGSAGSQIEKNEVGSSHSQELFQERSCTDLSFLMVFAAFWVGMVIVGMTAFTEGNINRILYGLDMAGNFCGTKDSSYTASPRPDFTDRKNLYWLNFTEFLTISDPSTMKTVCLSSCPTDTNTYVCLYNTTNGWRTDYYDTLSDDQKESSQSGDGPCYKVLMQTYPILNKCFPIPPYTVTNNSAKADVYIPLAYNEHKTQVIMSSDPENLDTGQLEGYGESAHDAPALSSYSMTDAEKVAASYEILTKQFSKARLAEYLADVWKGYKVVLTCGMGGGMVLSVVWIGMMRCCSGFVTWTTIVLINMAVLSFTLFCYIKAGTLASSGLGEMLEKRTGPLPSVFDPSAANKKVFQIVAYVMTVLTVAAVTFTWVLRKRVALAIACIKVASSALGSMPALLFFPLFPFVLSTILVVWVLFVAVYLYSDGQVVVQQNGGYKVQWDYRLRYMALYHLFGLLWTWQFIHGVGDVTVAGALSVFYWQRGKPVGKPLLTSLRRTLRYHLGSVALGSFFIAVLQSVRLIFDYMKRKTKPTTDGMVVTKFVLGIVKCFLWAVEAILTFVNRNAYIMVAIKGTNYCASAGHALGLMLKNVLRISAVDVISGLLIFVGQIMVGLTCGVAAFTFCEMKPYSDPDSRRYLSSPLLPVLSSTVVGFFVAEIFLQVYDMSIDTIMLCFCEDCNLNDNRPTCAPTVLMDALGLKGDTVPSATKMSEITTMPREEEPPAGLRLQDRSLSAYNNNIPQGHLDHPIPALQVKVASTRFWHP